jgi:2-haloacid dehalogenase
MNSINTIIFDLGAVLIDWNQRHLYRKIFKTEEEMEWFLANVCTSEWNEEQDAGRPFEEAVKIQTALFPEFAVEIETFWKRWPEMMAGPIEGTVNIFDALKSQKQHKFYALTNWSAETFPFALQRFEFFNWFDGIVVSGEEKTRKPFPEFYQILFDRYQVNPAEALFIDDSLRNIEAGQKLGLTTIHFQSSEQLREELVKRNLLK